LRFVGRALRRSSASVVVVVGATALAWGLVGPAAAQQIVSGPLKVTDAGPSVSPSGYAIKGVSGFSNDSAVFGYGTGAGALNIDGVTGYVDSPQSVGVVGWADTTSIAGYGVYGYSGTGNGVYGQSNNSNAASIYGINNAGGTAIYGYSTGQAVLGTSTGSNGVVGITNAPDTSGPNVYAGVLGVDNSTGPGYGVSGTSSSGTGVYGSSGTGAGMFATTTNGDGIVTWTQTGAAGYFYSASGDGLFINLDSGPGSTITAYWNARLQAAVGNAGNGSAFYGYSGNSTYPALSALAVTVGTDLFATYTAYARSVETFVVQGGTADYSGYAPTGSSDVQVSGDLYVQGQVYDLCSSSGGSFPVTSPAGHCTAVGAPAVVRSKSSIGSDVEMYGSRQSVPTVEDFGEAQLVNGQAVVGLDRTFASTIDRSRSYLVFVTPEGDCNGLYVTGKSSGAFTVRELRGGRSTVAFQYRIVAHPYRDDSGRLPLAPISHTLALPQTTLHVQHGNVEARLQKTPALGRRQGAKLGPLPERLPPPKMSASFRR